MRLKRTLEGWVGVEGNGQKRGEIPRLRKPTPSPERRRKRKSRRLAALGMTVMRFVVMAPGQRYTLDSRPKEAHG